MATPVEIVTGYLRSFRSGDAATIAAHVSARFRNDHLSSLGAGSAGRDEYLRRLPGFLAAFSDPEYEIEDIVHEDRGGITEVVVRYRFGATYDGRRIELPGVMWFGVEDGFIVRRADVWDSLTFLEQTGQH